MLPAVFGLFGDEQRWSLLTALSHSDLRVGELVERTGRPQSLVSYHLGELRSAGIVTSRRSSADGRDVYYRLDLARCRDLLTEASGRLHPSLGTSAVEPRRLAAGRRRRRVLFVCTGNSARSQMAEALLTARSGQSVEARSAGSLPKPLHPMAIEVMAERGIDISGNRSKHLSTFERTRFDRVVTLCDKVREMCPEFPGVDDRVHWSVPDPARSAAAEPEHAAFVAVADELEARIDALAVELDAMPDTRGRNVG